LASHIRRFTAAVQAHGGLVESTIHPAATEEMIVGCELALKSAIPASLRDSLMSWNGADITIYNTPSSQDEGRSIASRLALPSAWALQWESAGFREACTQVFSTLELLRNNTQELPQRLASKAILIVSDGTFAAVLVPEVLDTVDWPVRSVDLEYLGDPAQTYEVIATSYDEYVAKAFAYLSETRTDALYWIS
jgi:hypothetical protein